MSEVGRPPGAAWATWAEETLRGRESRRPAGALPAAALHESGLAPLVQAALRSVGDSSARCLDDAERVVVGQNLLRRARAQPFLDALSRGGVPHVVIKGEAAVRRDPSLAVLRPMGDIDVLVDPRYFRRAIGIGIGLGFTESRSREPVSWWWSCEREMRLDDVAPSVHLDLHRALHRPPLFVGLAADALRSAELVDGAWIPGVAESICIAAAHRAKHGFSGNARELLDVRRLLDVLGAPAHDSLVDAARRWEVDGALWLVWTLAQRWFGSSGDIEDAALRRLRSSLGAVRGAGMDWLAGLDGPEMGPKPWSSAPFLQMYMPMPIVTGRVIAPLRLAVTHALLRFGDALVAGPEAVGHLPGPLEPIVRGVRLAAGRLSRRRGRT